MTDDLLAFYYKTLGINKNSSQEEIKRAFRKKAAEHHPDRNDNDGKSMAAVNKAYSCLGDPEKRKRYDETGEDKRKNSFEQDVIGAMLTLFNEALEDDGDMLDRCKRSIQKALENGENKQAEIKAKIKKLRSRRKAIKTKRGQQNRIHDLIDQRILMLNEQIAQNKKMRKVVVAVKKELNKYESDEEIEQSTTGYYVRTITT